MGASGGVVTTTEYTLHGKLVTHLTRGSDEMHFFYDAQSRPAMVEFNGAVYSYIHNLQGDVVGIVDSAGSRVVEYKYDAWGKPTLVRTLTTAYELLAELNPFRYRGYVYDGETGFYYLRSRYYVPRLSKFLIPDIILGEVSVLQSHNAYLYCNNRPTICVDLDGNKCIIVLLLFQDGWIAFIINIPDEIEVEIGEIRKTENTVEATVFVDRKISPAKTEHNTFDFTFVPADRLEEYKTEGIPAAGSVWKSFADGAIIEGLLNRAVPGAGLVFALIENLSSEVANEDHRNFAALADKNPSGGVLIVDRAYTESGHFGYTEERTYYSIG